MVINSRKSLVKGSNIWEMETAEHKKGRTGGGWAQKHINKQVKELSSRASVVNNEDFYFLNAMLVLSFTSSWSP